MKLELKLSSRLCDYSDAYILFKGTMTVIKSAAQDQSNDAANKKIIFNNCAPFANYIVNNKWYTSRWCLWYWCSKANV